LSSLKLGTEQNRKIEHFLSLSLRNFFNNLITKSTDKIHCRYEAPREEQREAHGYLALGCNGYMVALSVDITLWESVKESLSLRN
jgi:hypothetical protein